MSIHANVMIIIMHVLAYIFTINAVIIVLYMLFMVREQTITLFPLCKIFMG